MLDVVDPGTSVVDVVTVDDGGTDVATVDDGAVDVGGGVDGGTLVQGGIDVVTVDDGGIDVVTVVEVVGPSQPSTQKTLCFVSAPIEPSAFTVSLTCHPCTGCGSKPERARDRSYRRDASRSRPPPAGSSPMKIDGSDRKISPEPVGG